MIFIVQIILYYNVRIAIPQEEDFFSSGVETMNN